MDRVPNKGPKGRQGLMEPKNEYWNIPLIRNEKVIERPPQQAFLTKRYTEEAVGFITAQAQKPGQAFFLYLAHSMPHVPLFASGAFKDTSKAGLYGDVIEEIDWSVGEILKALKKHDVHDNTIVVFHV